MTEKPHRTRAAPRGRTPARSASQAPRAAPSVSLLGDFDLHLFNEGSHTRLWERLGAHVVIAPDGTPGVYFAVWAPGARDVSVIGDFNAWDARAHHLAPRGDSGIWEGFVAGVAHGTLYKFHIASRSGHYRVDKADPFAIAGEIPPKTASVVWDTAYEWGDADWMRTARERNSLQAPISAYEVHLGSWRRVVDEGWRSLSYREMAVQLADYVAEMGFTHVELMPVMEHPFFGSWGYQVTSYFAPSARYGTPQDLMHLIDTLHQRGIGVILDWVPSHFPTDEHGLHFFDGTHLYEHADPRQGRHPDWDSAIFNYGRNEVRSFLLSSAMFWLDAYHADGLRVDAVASMLYLDYSRKQGEWIPNVHGGRENLDAVSFLRRLNEESYGSFPHVQTIAEESTAWPMVSRPTTIGGLGFGLKWDMGWMHDTLQHMQRDPVHRKFHHNELTFRGLYAFSENYVLPLSHDEVVYGKGSVYSRMPGDDWQKRANLRLLLGYQYALPGKKLLFMGTEFGHRDEWRHDAQLEWDLLEDERHQALRRWVGDLNRVYREEPALHRLDCDPGGFAWIDAGDAANSVLSFLRYDGQGRMVAAVANLTPVLRHEYRIGVPAGGAWRELVNSDARIYGGSGQGNLGRIEALPAPAHGHRHSLSLTLPPLSILLLTPSSQR
jgi:1,4-alpha-glucan branching enzyme